MKKTFTKLTLGICAVLFGLHVNAQIPYTFTQSTTTYVPVTGGTNLFNFPWDDEEEYVPMGFNFTYLGKTYSSVIINGNGLLIFDTDMQGAPLSSDVPVISVFGDYWMGGLGADLTDRGYDIGTPQSPIVYKTEGVAPNRIFMVEWQNAGFYNDDPLFDSYVNVQARINETTNDIQVIMGPNSVAPGLYDGGTTGPVIGLGTWDASTVNFLSGLYLSGMPSAAVAVNSYAALSGTPTDGTVFTFVSGVTGVHDLDKTNINIFPNPVAENLFVSLGSNSDVKEIKIIDMQGKIIRRLNVNNETEIKLYVSEFPSGVYTVILSGDNSNYQEKFVK